MDLNAHVDSPCALTSDWGFVGYVQDKTGPERAIGIGTYTTYCAGAAHANAWMKSTPNATRWEGQRLYVPLTSDEEMEA
jgi:hypothetical protein